MKHVRAPFRGRFRFFQLLQTDWKGKDTSNLTSEERSMCC